MVEWCVITDDAAKFIGALLISGSSSHPIVYICLFFRFSLFSRPLVFFPLKHSYHFSLLFFIPKFPITYFFLFSCLLFVPF